ncbi:MAG: hypothetical protein ACREKM_10605 [Longimicrobiales bacterium]
MRTESGFRRGVCTFLTLLVVFIPTRSTAQHRPQPVVSTHVTPAAVLPVLLPAGDQRAFDFAGGAGRLGRLQDEGNGRYTKRGLVLGAILGALGGLGTGALLAIICEVEGDGEGCLVAVPVVTILGAAGGAAVGAIIGAAIPRDSDNRDARADTTPAPPPEVALRSEQPDRTGSFGVALGRASATIHGPSGDEPFEGAGPAIRANVYAELRPWLAIGPEVGQAWFGDGGAIRHAALAVRGTWPLQLVSPFVAADLGAYQTTGPSLEFLGGGIGAGARINPLDERRFFLDVEARSSRNLHNVEPMRMTTFSLGGGFYW